jgi:hypothetical protein
LRLAPRRSAARFTPFAFARQLLVAIGRTPSAFSFVLARAIGRTICVCSRSSCRRPSFIDVARRFSVFFAGAPLADRVSPRAVGPLLQSLFATSRNALCGLGGEPRLGWMYVRRGSQFIYPNGHKAKKGRLGGGLPSFIFLTFPNYLRVQRQVLSRHSPSRCVFGAFSNVVESRHVLSRDVVDWRCYDGQ